MRILYDSKQPQFKTPFGTLTPGQVCTLHIHIPTSVLTTKVTCVFNHEDGSWAQNDVLAFQMENCPSKTSYAPFFIWNARTAFCAHEPSS